MPQLLNPRHEHFARLIVDGRKQAVAYCEAFDRKRSKNVTSSASALARKDDVKRRINELRNAAELIVQWNLADRMRAIKAIHDKRSAKNSDKLKAIELYTKMAGDGAAEKLDVNFPTEALQELEGIVYFIRTGKPIERPSNPGSLVESFKSLQNQGSRNGQNYRI